MNYGHPIEFGFRLTAWHATPGAAVALAQRAERLGLDLVTFPDRPDQPAFLDAWTLLSWVAGRTGRIRLAPNALHVPLRQPAVLARAAASLDLLSGGRLALALDADPAPEATTAMGGRRLPPAAAADAFGEAVDVIQGLLDAGATGPLHHHGEHHRLTGVQRGPVPTRHIPIWLAARSPRLLRMLGTRADGWLAELEHLQPGELRAANQIIDEAATGAGREPAEVRRLVNFSGRFSTASEGFLRGPSAQWVEELLPLVVDDGVGTLILATDDERTMERFAAEVVPALRAAVERELPARPDPGRQRSTAVRARRRPGIDYDAVPSSLVEAAVEPGDPDYPRVRSTYLRGGAPGLVLRARDTAEVVDALAFARAHTHLPFGVRSGGHGVSGRSTNDGGIVLDLGALDTIEILDRATRRVRIGAGARWMDVATALAPHGWALTSGDYGGVGVGGLATAGGIGWLAREHGLTIDHLVGVEMVLADGRVVRADAEHHPDLFWAVRGAGANFGVVTSFDFEVDEIGAVGWAQLVLDASDPTGLLTRWGAAVQAAPRTLTSNLIMGGRRHGQPAVAQVMAMVDSDQPETIIAQLQPLADSAPMYDQQVVVTSYPAVLANAERGGHAGQGEPFSRSGFVDHITPEFAAEVTRLLQSGVVYFFQIRSVGGAVADVHPDATAYANRSANFQVTALGVDRRRLDLLWDGLHRHLRGLYLSFDSDLRPERLSDAFPPRTLARLRELKRDYDPDNLFRDNFNIRPDRTSTRSAP